MGEHVRPDSPKWAQGRRLAARDLLELARAGDGDDLVWSWFAQSVVGLERVQRRADRARAAVALVGRLPRVGRLLADDAAELAVRVLAVGSMAVLAIYLRQRGSPESKPVGCPHRTTAVEGLTQSPAAALKRSWIRDRADVMAKDHGSSVKNDKQYEGWQEGHEQEPGGGDRQLRRLSSRGGKKSGRARRARAARARRDVAAEEGSPAAGAEGRREQSPDRGACDEVRARTAPGPTHAVPVPIRNT